LRSLLGVARAWRGLSGRGGYRCAIGLCRRATPPLIELSVSLCSPTIFDPLWSDPVGWCSMWTNKPRSPTRSTRPPGAIPPLLVLERGIRCGQSFANHVFLTVKCEVGRTAAMCDVCLSPHPQGGSTCRTVLFGLAASFRVSRSILRMSNALYSASVRYTQAGI